MSCDAIARRLTSRPRQSSPGRSDAIARPSGDIAWIRSYVLSETDGSLGTVCIYQASSPEKIMEHAEAADLPVDEIIPIADTVVVRPDPVAASARASGRGRPEGRSRPSV